MKGLIVTWWFRTSEKVVSIKWDTCHGDVHKAPLMAKYREFNFIFEFDTILGE